MSCASQKEIRQSLQWQMNHASDLVLLHCYYCCSNLMCYSSLGKPSPLSCTFCPQRPAEILSTNTLRMETFSSVITVLYLCVVPAVAVVPGGGAVVPDDPRGADVDGPSGGHHHSLPDHGGLQAGGQTEPAHHLLPHLPGQYTLPAEQCTSPTWSVHHTY